MPRNFGNALGEYLDCIPISVPIEFDISTNSVHNYISQLQTLKEKEEVNFLERIMTSDTKLNTDRIITLNNHSIFNMSFNQLTNVLQYMDNNDIDGVSYEIVINSYSGDLVLIYPVSIECKIDISKELQKACDHLDTTIALCLADNIII